MTFDLRQPPRLSLVAHIEEQLRDALVSGKLRPGQRLSIRELAQQLGTSPTPVREALIRLAAAKILVSEPNQAFRVPLPTRREYLEICKIRRAVEGLAAEEAALAIDAEGITRLEGLAAEFRTAKKAGDAKTALMYNRRFRFTLYSYAGMPHLLGIIESLWLRIGPCFNYLYPQTSITSDGYHNYDDAIAALRQRDVVAVRKAIEKAINQGAELLLSHLPDDAADARQASVR